MKIFATFALAATVSTGIWSVNPVYAETAVTPAVATKPAEPAKDPAFGKWRSNKGKVTIEVVQCQENKICANIIALAKPLNKAGKPKTDVENSDPALRSRPIIGLQVVNGMVRVSKNKWKGRIYNADDGRSYAATATVNGNRLVVEACIGPFCKKNRFTRAK